MIRLPHSFLLLATALATLPGYAATSQPAAAAAPASAATAAAAPASAASAAASAPASVPALAPAPAPAAPVDARAACTALQGSLADSAAGLKLDAAKVDSATLVEAGSSPAVCKVTGSVTAGGAPIRFQASLPTDWNRRAVQFADGVEAARLPVDPQQALATGYLVYGPAGAGSSGAPLPPEQHAIAAQKALHDVAQELMARRFGRLSHKIYLVSGAGGGLGIELAERHQYDYLGVLADASEPRGASGEAPAAATAPPASAASAGAGNGADPATALSGFSGSGGKLIVLAYEAPAALADAKPGAAASGASAPATATAANGAPAVAASSSSSSPAAAVVAYRAVLARLGHRYTDSYFRQYTLPAADARVAGRVDWLQVLVDWSEQGKAPSADLAQLPVLPERR